MICTLDDKNLELLTKILSEAYNGTLEEMIEEEFGIHLEPNDRTKIEGSITGSV